MPMGELTFICQFGYYDTAYILTDDINNLNDAVCFLSVGSAFFTIYTMLNNTQNVGVKSIQLNIPNAFDVNVIKVQHDNKLQFLNELNDNIETSPEFTIDETIHWQIKYTTYTATFDTPILFPYHDNNYMRHDILIACRGRMLSNIHASVTVTYEPIIDYTPYMLTNIMHSGIPMELFENEDQIVGKKDVFYKYKLIFTRLHHTINQLNKLYLKPNEPIRILKMCSHSRRNNELYSRIVTYCEVFTEHIEFFDTNIKPTIIEYDNTNFDEVAKQLIYDEQNVLYALML